MSNKRKAAKSPQIYTESVESPWPGRLKWIAAVVVVGSLVALVWFSQPAIRGVPEGTQTVAVGDPQHVVGDVHADGEVPAGGEHDGIWQNCGFYTVEIRTENAVHSLEHGAVWVTYDATLSDDEIQDLRRFVGRNRKVIVFPIPLQGSPIVATSWGRQLELNDAADLRLEQFVNEFLAASGAPESGARCNGGIGDPQF